MIKPFILAAFAWLGVTAAQAQTPAVFIALPPHFAGIDRAEVFTGTPADGQLVFAQSATLTKTGIVRDDIFLTGFGRKKPLVAAGTPVFYASALIGKERLRFWCTSLLLRGPDNMCFPTIEGETRMLMANGFLVNGKLMPQSRRLASEVRVDEAEVEDKPVVRLEVMAATPFKRHTFRLQVVSYIMSDVKPKPTDFVDTRPNVVYVITANGGGIALVSRNQDQQTYLVRQVKDGESLPIASEEKTE